MQIHNNGVENTLENKQPKDNELPAAKMVNDGHSKNGKEYPPTGKLSYYPPLSNLKKGRHHYPVETFDLQALYSKIAGDHYKLITNHLRNITGKKERDTFKAGNFYSVTPNGTFNFRDTNQLIDPSGYFILDLDDISEVERVKERLITDPEIRPVFLFVSPSGTGIKAFYNIDTSLIDMQAGTNKMEKPFYSLNNYLSLNHSDILKANDKGELICGSGKDLPRLCFVCHDPEVYYNKQESSIIDRSFHKKYYKVPDKKKRTTSKTVSPRTTIDDLAARHLTNDNHHPELLKFVSACQAIGRSKEEVLLYIDARVEISSDSAHSDRAKLVKEIEDIYTRYQSNSPDSLYLTPLTFAYDIFLFKYSKEASQFVLQGLYYEGVRQLLHTAGFWKRYDTSHNSIFIRQTGQIIEETTPEVMRDFLTRHVENIAESLLFIYQGINYQIPQDSARETFLKNSNNIFNDVWMEHLQIHTAPILKDTQEQCYIITPHTLLTITADSITQNALSELSGVCIWKKQQIKREFTYTPATDEKCHFEDFMRNVTSRKTENGTAYDSENLVSLKTAIGYLIHNHVRLSEGQAVIFYDNSITDIKTPMGGTGKGLIANALKQVRDVTKIDGKHLDGGNRFRFERISLSTQIAWLDDVRNDFDFSMLHTNLTDGWTIERKHLNQIFIEAINSPKVLICSNSVIKGGGTTNQRRQFIFELGDHYSSQIKTGLEKPIETEHCGLFFTDDWPQQQWNLFLSLLCRCVQTYLKNGLIPQKAGNLKLNRFRQATNDDFLQWCEEQEFAPGRQNEKDTQDRFYDFVGAYYGGSSRFSQRTFTGWLKAYAEFKGWRHDSRRTNGKVLFWFDRE